METTSTTETKNGKRRRSKSTTTGGEGGGVQEGGSPSHKRQKKPFNREEWEAKRGQPAVGNMSGRNPVPQSDLFLSYYKAQNIVPEDQWETFVQYLSKELPTTFRISTRSPFCSPLQHVLSSHFLSSSSLTDVTLADGTTLAIDPPRLLEWYLPKNNAWHYTVNKKSLRKTPVLKHFKKLLAEEQEVGHLARQEAVSMIPPLLLGIQSQHKILDMCAAPGSKTGQLIELLHSTVESHVMPSGIVVANDVDVRRCYMLTRHVQHYQSPCTLVTNYAAQAFPDITINGSVLKFDRVLCDVPCSGDGTIRKAPTVGSKWTAKNGLTLHGLQKAIAVRGLELLEVGGIMAYSTCAFNPIENEAVVANLLDLYGDALSILDVSDKLPSLKRVPGVSTWKVYTPSGIEVPAWSELTKDQTGLVHKTMFPPDQNNRFICDSLKRCLRFLPQDQDTGGFFITIIRKNSELPKTPQQQRQEEYEKSQPVLEEGAEPEATKKKKKAGGRGYPKEFAEDSFIPLVGDEELATSFASVRPFYGLGSEAEEVLSNLMTRSAKRNKLYLFNPLIHLILTNAYQIKDTTPPEEHLRVINAGVRLFTNETHRNKKLVFACPWRITTEGMAYLLPLLTKRNHPINLLDFAQLLVTRQPILFENLDDANLGNALKESDVGTCVITVFPPKDEEWESYLFKATTISPEEKEKNPLLAEVKAALDWNYLRQMCSYSPLSFLAWKGTTSVILHLTKLELYSVQNLLLTRDYSYQASIYPQLPYVASQKVLGTDHEIPMPIEEL